MYQHFKWISQNNSFDTSLICYFGPYNIFSESENTMNSCEPELRNYKELLKKSSDNVYYIMYIIYIMYIYNICIYKYIYMYIYIYIIYMYIYICIYIQIHVCIYT